MSDTLTRLNAALSGRYHVERQLGEGGMATVYLAEDLRHHRKVALKVLKPELAAIVGAERFLAEIRTTASLQHPHILPLFDSGEADKLLFYVMPHVEGESLEAKLAREHQLPVEEAVRIATNVAEALDYAHGHGVVHRDIKPANILLHSGKPVISDFGIALAVGAAGGGRLTETGLSLGTPHYMSPEQATGDAHVGPATDIYALGCVLYEMLAGEPPYTGSTPQAVLGKIIMAEPVSATKQRKLVPANVDAAIRKALEKLPADRFGSASEFAKALGDPGFRHGVGAAVGVAVGRGQWTPVALATTASTLVFAGAFGWSLLRREPPQSPNPVTRVSLRIPDDQDFDPGRGDFDLSSDGSLMVYRGVGDAGNPQLWVRRFDALDATPIRDTDGATRPAISPDGREVAFWSGDGIPVVPIQGGVARTLPVALNLAGSTPRWSPDGAWIYYSDAAQGLSRVPSGGGTAEVITELDTAAGDLSHIYVDVLPGGNAVYTAYGTGPPRIQSVDIETGEIKDLTTGRYPRYSATGHLLFQDATASTLLAAAFDVEALELRGAPRPLAEELMSVGTSGLGFNPGSFAVSQTGRLVYRTGEIVELVQRTAVWVDRDGSEEALPLPPRAYDAPRLSPDGTRLAVSVTEADGSQPLWVFDVASAAGLRLTQEGVTNTPIWTADGRIAFNTFPGINAIFTVEADGSSGPELLLPGVDPTTGDYPTAVTPDGGHVIFSRILTDAHREIFQVPLQGEPVAEPVLQGEFNRGNAEVSPDGRWLVYRSDQSGQMEVYVQPYPGPGPTVPVSIGGGTSVTWSPDGSELIYRLDDRVMAVTFTVDGGTPRIGPPTELFRGDYVAEALGGTRQYHVAPDGRFLMLRDAATGQSSEGELPPQVILVENFFEELRQMVPAALVGSDRFLPSLIRCARNAAGLRQRAPN